MARCAIVPFPAGLRGGTSSRDRLRSSCDGTRRFMTRLTASLAIALTMLAVVEAKAKFLSTWKAPAAANMSYAGKKVVGLVVSNDLALRMSTEEALARELTGKGLQGVAAYRVIPGEEVQIPERAKAWFEQNGTAGVVVMRLVDISKEQTPSVMVW